MNFLISDDSTEILNASVRCIKDAFPDADVRGFEFADQATREIENGFQPDFVFTDYDYGIGRQNGISYIKTLRSMGVNVPVFLISGSSMNYLNDEIEKEQLTGVNVLSKGAMIYTRIINMIKRSNYNTV